MDALRKAIRKMIKEELSNSFQINELTNREYMEGLTHIPSLEAIQNGVAQIAGDLYDEGFDLEDISDYLCDVVRQNLPTSMEEATIETTPEKLDKVKAKADKDDVIKVTEEEEEPKDEDIDKKDSVSKISNKLQKLVADMKKKAKEYKDAEGEDKEKIKDELKTMTKEKKKLEGQLA